MGDRLGEDIDNVARASGSRRVRIQVQPLMPSKASISVDVPCTRSTPYLRRPATCSRSVRASEGEAHGQAVGLIAGNLMRRLARGSGA
jgi:hypothetical protein